MRISVFLASAVSFLVLAGCASDPARQLAKATSVNVTDLSEQLENYKKAQEEISENRLRRQVQIDTQVARYRAELDSEIRISRAISGMPDQMSLFDRLKQLSDQSIAADAELRSQITTRTAEINASLVPIETQRMELASISKQLAALADTSSTGDQLAGIAAIVSGVKEQVKQARELKAADAEEPTAEQTLEKLNN